MDYFQLMHADLGSHLDILSDEMCQMNTRIDRIAHQQSYLGGFAPSPPLDPFMESSASGDDDNGDAFGFAHNDKMTVSQ